MLLRLSRRVVVLLPALSLGLCTLSGCGSAFVSSPAAATAIVVTGNWQFSSAAGSAAQLPSLSGELTGTNTAFTGILHSNSASACVPAKNSFVVTGSADAQRHLTLTGGNVAGGTLVLTGILAADGKSISNSSYTVNGGSCAFAKPASSTAQVYADITGTYTGSFTDPDGDQIPVQATLTQNPSADTSGNFQLSGTGTFGSGNDPCFVSPTPVTSAQVTGGTFNVLYTDARSQAQIDIHGTFSTDAKTLTVSGAQVVSPCGSTSGTGVLTKQ